MKTTRTFGTVSEEGADLFGLTVTGMVREALRDFFPVNRAAMRLSEGIIGYSVWFVFLLLEITVQDQYTI